MGIICANRWIEKSSREKKRTVILFAVALAVALSICLFYRSRVAAEMIYQFSEEINSVDMGNAYKTAEVTGIIKADGGIQKFSYFTTNKQFSTDDIRYAKGIDADAIVVIEKIKFTKYTSTGMVIWNAFCLLYFAALTVWFYEVFALIAIKTDGFKRKKKQVFS